MYKPAKPAPTITVPTTGSWRAAASCVTVMVGGCSYPWQIPSVRRDPDGHPRWWSCG
jgi:hypothetical protein